jgi:hypothetical protein
MVRMEPVAGLPELDLENLALLNEGIGSDPVALTANDDITNLPVWLFDEKPDDAGRLQNATSCVVILVDSGSGADDVDVFYFCFYSYDRGANITQVLPPIKGLLEDKIEPDMSFGDHVGDW